MPVDLLAETSSAVTPQTVAFNESSSQESCLRLRRRSLPLRRQAPDFFRIQDTVSHTQARGNRLRLRKSMRKKQQTLPGRIHNATASAGCNSLLLPHGSNLQEHTTLPRWPCRLHCPLSEDTRRRSQTTSRSPAHQHNRTQHELCGATYPQLSRGFVAAHRSIRVKST